MTRNAAHLQGAALGFGAFGLYALYDISIKYLGGNYSPLQVLFVACSFAMLPVLVQVARGPGGPDLRVVLRPVLPGWTVLRVLVTLLNGVLGVYAFARLPLAECYAIFFLMPLLISLIAVPMLKERLDPVQGLAILVGFAGVVIALRPGQVPVGPVHAAAFLGAATGALNYLIIRRTAAVERSGVLLFWPLFGQAAALLLVLPWIWMPMPWSDLGICALMAAAVFVGGRMIVAAYARAPAVVVAPMQYSQILWAVVLGALMFDEWPDAMTLAGTAVIVAAGLFLMVASARRTTAPVAAP